MRINTFGYITLPEQITFDKPFNSNSMDTLSWGCAQVVAEIVFTKMIETQGNYIGGTLNADLYPVDAICAYMRKNIPMTLLGYYVYTSQNTQLNQHDIIQKINNKTLGIYDKQHTSTDIYLNPNNDISIVFINGQNKRVSSTMNVKELDLQYDLPNGNNNINIKKIGPIDKSL